MFMKTIKFLFPVLLLSLTIGLNSCSSNEDPEDLILGTWEYNGYSFDVRTSNPTVTAQIKEAYESFLDFEVASLTFNADGKVIMKYDGGDTDTEPYKFENGKLVIDEEPMVYTLDKNKLSIEIINLDAEELAEIEEDFTDVTIQKVALIVNFKKK